MSLFFAPMSDQTSAIMAPIDPLLSIERGYGRPLAAAPVDPMYRGDFYTPTMDIYGGGGAQFASPALNGFQMGGIADVMDVFSVVRFLAEEGR
jgi:hypothetical protein